VIDPLERDHDIIVLVAIFGDQSEAEQIAAEAVELGVEIVAHVSPVRHSSESWNLRAFDLVARREVRSQLSLG
jgi:hypothetical protein